MIKHYSIKPIIAAFHYNPNSQSRVYWSYSISCNNAPLSFLEFIFVSFYLFSFPWIIHKLSLYSLLNLWMSTWCNQTYPLYSCAYILIFSWKYAVLFSKNFICVYNIFWSNAHISLLAPPRSTFSHPHVLHFLYLLEISWHPATSCFSLERSF